MVETRHRALTRRVTFGLVGTSWLRRTSVYAILPAILGCQDASLLFFFSLQHGGAGRPPSISFIEKNIAVVWRGAAPRAGVYVHLNLVTRLPWEKFEILIYCVGASRSFPFPFASHYALLARPICYNGSFLCTAPPTVHKKDPY